MDVNNLARLGTSRTDLVDVYYKQCRSVLEMAAPAWTPGLTKTEISQLERVQKAACAIILGKKFLVQISFKNSRYGDFRI